jgi:DNA-binding SARP family transcriptional activator/tetratricopeptide (TPR) repeat protein
MTRGGSHVTSAGRRRSRPATPEWGWAVTVVRLRILGESVIQVGDRCIAPDSPQLFALALYLGHAEGRPVHKSELLELLFPDVDDARRASHSLRQLLYRLRRLGVPIVTEGGLLRLAPDFVTSTLEHFVSQSREERIRHPASTLSILPAYEPRVSRQLGDWIETVRSNAQARLRAALQQDFRGLQRDCSWQSVVTVGRIMQSLLISNEEIVSGVAQALMMQGQKYEALEVIDSFVADCDPSSLDQVRRLRARVNRTREQKQGFESALHGRNEAIASLSQQWESTVRGISQVAIVAGPPGIGKTRLASDFTAYASLQGGHALTYRCDASDASRPHALFKRLLPHLRSLRGSLGAAPGLQHQLARLAEDNTAAIEPALTEAMRSELQMALVDLVEAVAAETPILLVVDDAHFLDPASRAVLEIITDRDRDVAVMAVYAYRGTESERITTFRARFRVYLLAPLSTADSLAVLKELLPQKAADERYLEECAAQAGGNPYYLHAIARSDGLQPTTVHSVPFDISAFAAAAYLGLNAGARSLFESCILLGRFADLQRVKEVASLEGQPLVLALRTLEDQGLLTFSHGELRCAHALLAEASRPLIPMGVAAALHERIATRLEREAAADGYPDSLASVAAEHWLAAGDVASASRLLQRCAAQAAALGEPSLAASMLLELPHSELPAADRIVLLQAIVTYAEVAGSSDVLLASLHDLLNARKAHGSSAERLRELEFRIIEADLERGAKPSEAVVSLSDHLNDVQISVPIRVRAGIRLLIAADMGLDSHLAKETLTSLRPVLEQLARSDPLRVRAELIYETIFGDKWLALEHANALLASNPVSGLHRDTVRARDNAAYAYTRLGLRDLANPVLAQEYQYMASRHSTREAARNVLLLADNSLSEGDLAGAARWLAEATALVGTEPRVELRHAGYYSAAANLAIVEGRFDDAERLINTAYERYPTVGLPRYRAFALAIRLRAALLRRGSPLPREEFVELHDLYRRGGHLGGQDPVVETLWLYEVSEGRESQASLLLTEYLFERRREVGPPEFSLQITTGGDSTWTSWHTSRNLAGAM